MNKLLSLFIVSLFVLSVPTSATETQGNHNVTVEKKTEEVKSSMTIIEKKVRDAAVKVSSSTGHGSGSVIAYKDVILVLTAQHVAEGLPGDFYVISKDSESQLGVLIYSDALHDIAILYMPNPLREVKPMKYDPLEGIAEVGTDITYSGYLSDHQLIIVRCILACY